MSGSIWSPTRSTCSQNVLTSPLHGKVRSTSRPSNRGGVFLLRESAISSHHLTDVQQQAACRVRLDRNCQLQFGKDVNAQHKESWLWGQRVLTRRHVVLLPRCVEQIFSDPPSRMRKLKRCWTTSTWVANVAVDAFIEQRGRTEKNNQCDSLAELGNELLASVIHTV